MSSGWHGVVGGHVPVSQGLTKRAPLEKGIANHFRVIASIPSFFDIGDIFSVLSNAVLGVTCLAGCSINVLAHSYISCTFTNSYLSKPLKYIYIHTRWWGYRCKCVQTGSEDSSTSNIDSSALPTLCGPKSDEPELFPHRIPQGWVMTGMRILLLTPSMTWPLHFKP